MIFNNNTKQKKDTDKIKNMHPVKNEKETKNSRFGTTIEKYVTK
jgi:hypothetical protein